MAVVSEVLSTGAAGTAETSRSMSAEGDSTSGEGGWRFKKPSPGCPTYSTQTDACCKVLTEFHFLATLEGIEIEIEK